MKKVLIISTVGLVYDGITSVILSYLQFMNLDGLAIYVAGTIDVKESIKKQIEDTGCIVVDFPNRRKDTFNYFIALCRFIRKNHIDVVHAHGNSGTLAIEMLAAKISGCPKRIAHSHNTKCNQVKADKILKPLFRTLYTDGLACGVAAGKWLFGNDKFKVLTNGRDVDKYKFNIKARNDIRESLGIKNSLIIGHVGGFYEQKNHGFLLDIYREIKKIESDCRLIMIGDGPLFNQIKNECGNLEVIFTGNIDNVADYLNAMDGMLLPSLFEGFPLVSVEWQINGLPCILSNSITEECRLTNLVNFLSLKDGPKKWAELIIQEARSNNRKKSADEAYQTLKKSDYNINKAAKLLERLYKY